MTNKQILTAIIAGCNDYNTLQQAARFVRREPEEHTLVGFYRRAQELPGAEYPPEVVKAMQDYEARWQRKQPYNQPVIVQFRCTVNQRNIMHMLAKREGKTLSQFIRDRCLDTNR